MSELATESAPPTEVPRWALGLGLLVFVGGLIFALPAVEFNPSAASLGWLAAAALIGVPLMTLSNAVEFQRIANLRQHEVKLVEAIEVAVSSTAANLLPLPGGSIVKIAALKRAGSSTRGAAIITIWAGALWLGVAATVAGGALLIDGEPWAWIVIAGGAAVGAGAAFALARSSTLPSRPRVIASLALVELGATLSSALRLWFVGNALGVSLGVDVFVIALAPVLGAAVV
ncbi:MAG: hypothetical protein HKN91_04685, partial [Acidimicrobiia bacterium]|nr:hypothetical protein [Acidimicrobiia bacterium]